MASEMENVVARVHGIDEKVDTQSKVETLRSRTVGESMFMNHQR